MNILRYYHANHKNLLASSIENCPVGLESSGAQPPTLGLLEPNPVLTIDFS